MVLTPRRTAAAIAAAFVVLFAALAVLVASPGPAGAGPTPKPDGPAVTVGTPADADDDTGGAAGYRCTGGRPDRQCAPRGYGTASSAAPSTPAASSTPPVTTRPPTPSASSTPPAPELPKTGLRLTIIVGVGVLTVLAGWALLRLTRRRG